MSYTQKFQISTSEQVYPFEKASDGSTLYCIRLDLGVVPSGPGFKNVTHSISGFSYANVHSARAIAHSSGDSQDIIIPHTDSTRVITLYVTNTQCVIYSSYDGYYNTQNYQIQLTLIYKK